MAPYPNDGRFAAVLRAAMLREILTQRDVAKSVGCSQAAVSGWVRGTHLPNTLDYPRLLELFPADEKKLRRAYEQDFRERHS